MDAWAFGRFVALLAIVVALVVAGASAAGTAATYLQTTATESFALITTPHADQPAIGQPSYTAHSMVNTLLQGMRWTSGPALDPWALAVGMLGVCATMVTTILVIRIALRVLAAL